MGQNFGCTTIRSAIHYGTMLGDKEPKNSKLNVREMRMLRWVSWYT